MLEIRNLNVSYNHHRVLQDVGLTLRKGETISVIGESGAGKTTLGLSIMGLVKGACAGEILFNRADILTLPEDKRRRLRGKELAMVFQNVADALHPLYTVADQVAESIMVHHSISSAGAVARAGELLDSVGLNGHRAGAYPHQLSGGEKQRVLIAMALANDPAVVILDEPTASLDALTKAEIIGLLRGKLKDKIALVVTHDISVAADLSDKMVVLYGGRVLEAGATPDLLTMPRHPYTRGLLRAYPGLNSTKDLQGIPGRFLPGVEGCPFHPRCTQKIDICARKIPRQLQTGNRLVTCHRGGIIPQLELRGISKSYGHLPAVQDVNLTLYEGETVSLVGESGSGKTTLAKTIMGLFKDHAGEILLEGQNYAPGKKAFYQKVQMIFQNPGESISHRMNVLQAVKEPLDIRNSDSEEEKLARVKQVLHEVELPCDHAFLSKYPHHLSGGEAQRVAIARALVQNPRVLVADEPTSALDASVQAKILKLLLNLQEKRGLAMLLITHDIALAKKVSDRMAVMVQGRIVEEGPAGEVVYNPRHAYTKRLLAPAPAVV
ncbi:MAG: ABC transporter ATP-binding protein [Firmicutes bacterium]|nr:ABC transporter ATP-binding protein [Bacillota bacterium]